jgi:type I restriction enzyme M protein
MKFEVVVANPPFSLDKWGHDEAGNDPYKRFHRGLPPQSKGDYAFISHMIETTTKDSGRVGVVVPHGVLFRASSEGKIRQQLIEENLLDAVIGLPANLFYGTGIPAAVLVFKRNKTDSNVLFIDASRDYQNDKNQNRLRQTDINKIVATYQARESVDKYAYLASFEEIKDNDFNLNIPRYVDTFEEEAEIDIEALQVEISQIETELNEVKQKMAEYLMELGYASA